jgi:hypothetical protein
MTAPDPADVARWTAAVGQLHQVVDQLVAPLEAQHAGWMRCARGCHGCCVDGLTVTGLEARWIASRRAAWLATATPAPAGGCAMLDASGACRIYEDRPYVCRTQGLPLRWLEAGVEHRDVCPVHDPGDAITALPADACWSLGPFEARLAAWSEAAGLERVALRDLFGGERASTSP